MTSMTVAPKPISAAHLNPRCAPSFRIVRLIGPIGMESRRPKVRPVKPATRIGGSSSMNGQPGILIIAKAQGKQVVSVLPRLWNGVISGLWGGFGEALGRLWGGFGVALGWLWTPEYMPSICLLYGFAVALGGFARAFCIPQCSRALSQK